MLTCSQSSSLFWCIVAFLRPLLPSVVLFGRKPLAGLCISGLICLLFPNHSLSVHRCSFLAYCHLPRQYAAPSVPGHVQSFCGERGHVPVGYEKHVQPQTARTQEVWPQGNQYEQLLGNGTPAVWCVRASEVFFVSPQLILPPGGWINDYSCFMCEDNHRLSAACDCSVGFVK